MNFNFLLQAADTGAVVGIAVAALVVGLVAGYFLARWLFIREMKKNPPISEKSIRAMYLSMGRKPSEAQIHATIRAMQEANKSGSKKK